ncbi:DUF3298 domain-containing protein [Robertmurraya yapensis]|uniref:DUF3298 domain-containing protein n=1 Tax=Bacillus yapensis TaxID=2492960 RepID=A0A3S0I8R0_9BACI|nr:DUF3298 domain-containing protein [Bacillus yapensis]RTR27823.1 DUF3298 domain-containing protein [Bacillus yapensis]TKS94226.1 DUF3298 domain-containing protein [Bacillus yapensis]
MNDKKIEQLKEQYKEIPIPLELNRVVYQALEKRNSRKALYRWGVGVAAAIIIFTTSINVSPAFAKKLTDVPVVGDIVEVLTFKKIAVDEGNYQADLDVPKVEMDNEALEEGLNSKYLEESKALYEKFMSDMQAQKAIGEDGHLRVDSGFEIKTETDHILSIGRYVEETQGSSMTTLHYDTIDKQKQLLVTLPSLFKDDTYIEAISANIKAQMRQQMEVDTSKTYWLEPSEPDGFKSISKDQEFYINADNQLVISFDEFEVAPGYMGVVEFVIPTDVVADVVVSDEYLK